MICDDTKRSSTSSNRDSAYETSSTHAKVSSQDIFAITLPTDSATLKRIREDKSSPSSSPPDKSKSTKTKLPKLTKREILTVLSLAYGNFCLGTFYAILAPFFPHEAEKKEVSPTQYGVIFGVFEFGQFVFSPICGRLIPHLSPKFLLVMGLFVTGWCNLVFGALEWSPHGFVYFILAFIMRLMSSVGSAAFLTACFTVIVVDFPTRVSTLFATTEMAFGLGMIVGPSIGGILFEIGGFSLPFFTSGALAFVGTVVVYIWLPEPKTPQKRSGESVSVWKLFCNCGIFINILITFTTFMNVGFNDATLEHHIRDFTVLTPTAVGGIFLVSGLIYAVCSQGWGILINRCSNAHPFVLVGYILSLGAFLLSGPMYPIPLEPNLTLIIISQAIYGISMGGQLVGSFTEGLRSTIKSGFPDNISTSAAMSSLYQSACALGAALGPVIGGYLMDNYGYAKASIFMVSLQILMIIVIIVYGIKVKYFSGEKEVEEDESDDRQISSSLDC